MRSRKPVRVLHVGKFYAPVVGGIESVVQELVGSFRDDSEIEADVLVSQLRGPSSIDEVDGVKVRRVRGYGVLMGAPLCPAFAMEITRLAGTYDIVHVHVPNPLPFLCDWSKLTRQGVRLISIFTPTLCAAYSARHCGWHVNMRDGFMIPPRAFWPLRMGCYNNQSPLRL